MLLMTRRRSIPSPLIAFAEDPSLPALSCGKVLLVGNPSCVDLGRGSFPCWELRTPPNLLENSQCENLLVCLILSRLCGLWHFTLGLDGIRLLLCPFLNLALLVLSGYLMQKLKKSEAFWLGGSIPRLLQPLLPSLITFTFLLFTSYSL